MENGCDISTWQSVTPTGYAFVFARATYTTVQDTRWPQHRDNILRMGSVLGAYAFGTIHATAAAQAAAFIKAVGRSTRLVALDMEPESHNVSWAPEPVWDEMSDAAGAEFIRLVKAQGYNVGLYHSESGFPELGQDFDWVAHWGVTEPTRHHLFHQYRGAPLDLDHYDGTLASLQALATFGGDMGLDVRWLVTADPDPYDALGTAKVGAGAITFWKVEDGSTMQLAATNLNVVQRGVMNKALNAGYPAGTPVIGTTINGQTWVTPLAAVTFTPLTKPAIDCSSAVALATAPLKATIAEQDAIIAGEPARTEAAIAADRATATVKHVIEYGN